MILRPPFRLIARDSVGSTNDEARLLAEQGAAHGTVVSAEEQTAGRGRRGRKWESPCGNLHCSILLDPGPEQARAAELVFVAAVALRAALAELAPKVTIACKWPNDILCDGRKVAGMLLEWAGRLVVLGVGVNLVDHPPEALYPATNLRRVGCAATPLDVLATFCGHLDRIYLRWRRDGFAWIRETWLAHAIGMDQPATARLADGTVLEGTASGIDEHGALLLDMANGERRTVMAADVFFAYPGES